MTLILVLSDVSLNIISTLSLLPYPDNEAAGASETMILVYQTMLSSQKSVIFYSKPKSSGIYELFFEVPSWRLLESLSKVTIIMSRNSHCSDWDLKGYQLAARKSQNMLSIIFPADDVPFNFWLKVLHCLSLSSCQLESTLPPAAQLLLSQPQQATWSGTICDFRTSLREFLDPVMNRFTWQRLPTINRKHFGVNILCVVSFCPQKRTTERCSSIVYTISTVPFWLLKPASERAHARLLPRLFYFEKINIYIQ
jgi:hypothetical protein